MTRGGKRKGSGRPTIPNKKLKVTITLRPDHVRKLTGHNTSKVIENLLDDFFTDINMKKIRSLKK